MSITRITNDFATQLFDETNRSSCTNIYRDDSGTVFLGFAEYPEITQDSMQEYITRPVDYLRFDLISDLYFNNPYLWWFILHYNNITNPYDIEDFAALEIPTQTVYNAFIKLGSH
jgi:hypothetical protein